MFYNILPFLNIINKHSQYLRVILRYEKNKAEAKEEKMKLRKRSFIIGGIALLAAGILSVGLLTGCRPFPGHGPGPHRFCKKDFSEHVLKKMDKKVAKLDLSEDQYEKYMEIRQKVAADLDEGMERKRQLHFSC